MDKWYLIQFKPNAHNTAERNLNLQGFKTFLPLQELTLRNKSQFTIRLKPLFPGYMFVNLDLNATSWRKIKSTFGVSQIVCSDGIPQAIPHELIFGLISRCDRYGKLLLPEAVMQGDTVEFIAGAFTNFVATVEAIDSEKRIWVMLDFMGKNTRVQVTSKEIRSLL